jgi:hypothetical protein
MKGSIMRRTLIAAAAASVVSIGLALAAAGPANLPGIFGEGLHGTPRAIMGCDAATPVPNCSEGVAIFGQDGTAGDVCANPSVAKSSAPINIGATTTTKIVDISGSAAIYVCGFTFSLAGTTPTFTFKSGTHGSADCDTTPATLSGTYAPTAGQLVQQQGPTVGVALKTAASQQLCGTTTGTGSSAQGVLQYAQQ